jgi:hypothetical protein
VTSWAVRGEGTAFHILSPECRREPWAKTPSCEGEEAEPRVVSRKPLAFPAITAFGCRFSSP